ncbi:PAS domain-containing protein, partial [Flavihumibacter sediminis]|nr:PAS domain-containing protein [Flavihumibacter sediminis]
YPSEEGVSVFFRDISLRKEADARLQKAYEERTTILESIGDAFFAVDNNWIVTYWNKMAEEVLFRKKADIVGKHLWTEYADAIDSDFYRMYHRAKETGDTVS